MTNCPTCKKGKILDSDIFGEYCSKCGLIITTYFNKQKQKKRKKKQVKINKKGKCCIGCRSGDNLTVHHIIPQRIERKEEIIILCRSCHNIADRLANVFYSDLKIGEE